MRTPQALEAIPAWAGGLVCRGRVDEACPVCGNTDEDRFGAEENASYWIGITLPDGPRPRPRLCVDCYEDQVPEQVRRAIAALADLVGDLEELAPAERLVLVVVGRNLFDLVAGLGGSS